MGIADSHCTCTDVLNCTCNNYNSANSLTSNYQFLIHFAFAWLIGWINDSPFAGSQGRVVAVVAQNVYNSTDSYLNFISVTS